MSCHSWGEGVSGGGENVGDCSEPATSVGAATKTGGLGGGEDGLEVGPRVERGVGGGCSGSCEELH